MKNLYPEYKNGCNTHPHNFLIQVASETGLVGLFLYIGLLIFKTNMMETKETKAKYQEWLSPEIIHKGSLNWLSELKFIKDEQLFFDDLIKSYTLQLIESKHYKKSKDIIDKLNELKKDTKTIIGIVQAHEHDLKILVDGVDQLTEEEAYRKEHLRLIIDVSNFLEKYRGIKKQVFKLIKGIIKEGKQKRLLP